MNISKLKNIDIDKNALPTAIYGSSMTNENYDSTNGQEELELNI